MKRIILPNGDILFVSAITKITKIRHNAINSSFEVHYNGGYTTLSNTEIKTTLVFIQINNFLDNNETILTLESNAN